MILILVWQNLSVILNVVELQCYLDMYKINKVVELQYYLDNNKILFIFDLMLEFGGVFSMDWYYIVVYVEFFDDGVV